uniref:Vesicle transport through interaction with t-SNAREs 1A n=1 Tax=Gallus gallus TaxID=9031 RepID=A0A8V0ZIB6_CHICK
MSSDFESYEQDFAVLTADITGRIGRVPKLLGDEKKQMVANIEKQLEEARELLEQMELEVREIPPQSRGMYSSRMRSYKQEMGKLEADFVLKTVVPKLRWLLGLCSVQEACRAAEAAVMALSCGLKWSCIPCTCVCWLHFGATY